MGSSFSKRQRTSLEKPSLKRQRTSPESPTKRQRTSLESSGEGDVVVASSSGGSKKHLYVFLMHFSAIPGQFSIQSVPVESLINASDSSSSLINTDSSLHEEHDSTLPQLNQVLFLEKKGKHPYKGMGFICVRDKLYMCDGEFEVPHIEGPWSSNFSCFDFSRATPSCEDNEKVITLSHLQPMSVGNTVPMVAEIDELIYAIHATPFPHPHFEVYDPSEKVWRSLDIPPFLIPMITCPEAWFERNNLSPLVIGKKLYVSTVYASFAFDTKTEKWENSELFLGFNDRYSGSTLFDEKKYRMVGIHGGPPFANLERIILYEEDTMICCGTAFAPLVVAYQIVEGRVRKMQLLSEVNKYLLEMEASCCDNLVHLGGGYICYHYQPLKWVENKSFLRFVTFKVSKIGGNGAVQDGPGSDFLRCEFLKAVTLEANTNLEGKSSCEYSFAL